MLLMWENDDGNHRGEMRQMHHSITAEDERLIYSIFGLKRNPIPTILIGLQRITPKLCEAEIPYKNIETLSSVALLLLQ